jgi:cytochrome c
MKRTIVLTSFICAMLVANYSFGQTKKKTVTVKKTTTITKTTVAKPSAADLVIGKQALSKSDCLACHKEDTKVIGPAYIDVAKKYSPTEANYDMLVKKIIAGGAGNWGTTPMSPHPSLPPADVKKMVQYILSLN